MSNKTWFTQQIEAFEQYARRLSNDEERVSGQIRRELKILADAMRQELDLFYGQTPIDSRPLLVEETKPAAIKLSDVDTLDYELLHLLQNGYKTLAVKKYMEANNTPLHAAHAYVKDLAIENGVQW